MNLQPTPSPDQPLPPTGAYPMDGEGRLIFRVTTAKGAIPLANARVTLWDRRPEPDTDRGNTLAVYQTDRNGKTPIIPLPAPAKALSMAPSPQGSPPPFACYDAEVLLEGYTTLTFVCIPVFDGVTSVQPADLIPLPANGYPDGLTPDGTRIVESENPNL